MYVVGAASMLAIAGSMDAGLAQHWLQVARIQPHGPAAPDMELRRAVHCHSCPIPSCCQKLVDLVGLD